MALYIAGFILGFYVGVRVTSYWFIGKLNEITDSLNK